MPTRTRQRGVALITVLLVVVIATIAASAMALRQQLDVRRSARIMELGQARLFNHGLETWAGQILAGDDKVVDHLKEPWATLLPPIPVDGWVIGGQLIDLQGRFNVNNLLTADGKVDDTALAQLQRLLTSLQLDPGLAYAVLDWIDVNDEASGFQGAEDMYYMARQPSYRAANRLIVDLSELRLVRGFDEINKGKPEKFGELYKLLTALPVRTTLNINTATAQVMSAMIKDLKVDDAKRMLSEGPFKTMNDVLANKALPADLAATEKATLDIRSQFFLLRASARRSEAGDATRQELSSILRRTPDGKIQVVARGEGN